jgi:hypothetical protein
LAKDVAQPRTNEDAPELVQGRTRLLRTFGLGQSLKAGPEWPQTYGIVDPTDDVTPEGR